MMSSSQLIALMARILEILESSTLLRQLKRFQRTTTTPVSMNIDEDGNFLANEQIVSDIDNDLALYDEEYHEALLGYREARDLMKEGPCCSWILSCCCPHFVQTSILAEEKVIPQVSKM